jgi:hypothetical protein
MNPDPKDDAANTAPRAMQKQSREDRLKAALKANMARRKAQARARAAETGQNNDDE